MAGRILPPVDQHGRGKRACTELANTLGFEPAVLYAEWAVLAQMLEYRGKMDRRLAEYCAVQMMPELYDKRGMSQAN